MAIDGAAASDVLGALRVGKHAAAPALHHDFVVALERRVTEVKASKEAT